MSTNEKIEIKEAVDAKNILVKRRTSELPDVKIEGGIQGKGVLLTTEKLDGGYSGIYFSREETKDLIMRLKYAVDVSEAKEAELLAKRLIDFRLDYKTKQLFKGLADRETDEAMRIAAEAYINYSLDTADYDAIKHSMLYKYAEETFPHCGTEDMVDELVNQFWK